MSPLETATVEQCLCDKWGEVKSSLYGSLREGESYVRTEPLKAVAYAAAAGYVLRVLPVGAIVRSVVKISLVALKPAALLYGAAKTYEIIVKSRKSVVEGV